MPRPVDGDKGGGMEIEIYFLCSQEAPPYGRGSSLISVAGFWYPYIWSMMTTKTIMVVDDEDSIRQSISDVLKDEGFKVISARDGHEALKLLDSIPPDIVLLDIWMPGMEATEALKRIK